MTNFGSKINKQIVRLKMLSAPKIGISILMFALFTGCSDWPPVKMLSPVDAPQDSADIDPWIAKLLNTNVKSAKQTLDARLKSDNPSLAPLVKELSEFVPCQVAFSSGIGYLRCVRRYKDDRSLPPKYDVLYVAQPLPSQALKSRLEYFEESVRPLMEAFLNRFAGSGEEMEGTAGQFTYRHWPTASDLGGRNAESFGDYRNARLLYAATNGDSVFIKPNGSTAWHTLETDEMIPIASTIEQFIEVYADFRKTQRLFDSWAFREFQKGRIK
jgi:hypothetical protein